MIKFRITILLTVLMSMSGVTAFAHDIEVANKDGVTIYYKWINDNTELAVTNKGDYYYSYSGDVVIPESVEYEGKTYGVTSIGKSAFQDCSGLTSVTIPNSVTSIGEYSFCKCSGLTSVTIPNSVISIGELAFSYCDGLTSVTIPNSVTSIGIGAFSAINLASILVESGNTVYDSRENCNAIIEKSSNTLIAGCKNTTIPNSVTSIGKSAFYRCSGLTSVTIPSSVTSIGEYAFRYCSGLTSIKVEDGNLAYDSRNNCNAIIEKSSNTLIAGCKNTTIPNSVTSIGAFAFLNCSGLTSVIILSSVTSIGEYAFYDCSGLTSVTIPNSVTSIGAFAFLNCSGLTSVIIPNSVTSIGWYAFSECRGLISVTIPNSVTSIGESAFSFCRRLTSITCKADTPPTCGGSAFYRIDKSACKLYVPKGHKADYQAADQWKEFTNIEEEESSETTEDAIKITSAGQTTWCSKYDLDFTDVEGIKAYTAGGYDRVSGTIWLMRVNQVPAKEGILIIGTPGDYKVPHKSTGTYYVNMMKGTLQPITINETEGEYTNYYLSNGDSGVGFYKVNGSVALKANRAYLPLLKGTTQAGTRFIGIGFEDDGTTNLTPALSKGEGEGAWYTLQGQRVAKPGKGIYIRNGKKVVIK